MTLCGYTFPNEKIFPTFGYKYCSDNVISSMLPSTGQHEAQKKMSHSLNIHRKPDFEVMRVYIESLHYSLT